MHICYGYGIKANLDWKKTLGDEWRQYEQIFPALAKSRIDQVSLECIHSHVPLELMGLLKGKDVLVGVIDVASDKVETPQEVAATIRTALKYVPAKHLFPCTNCGMAPMDREVAAAKLRGARRRRGARAQEAPQEIASKEMLHPTLATRGMVACPHALASAAGVDALRAGGSAVDAAVAAASSLARRSTRTCAASAATRSG